MTPAALVRRLETDAERRAAVALQEEIWGAGFADRVPASILMVAEEMGGVASGAFEGDRLVGLVFGITGIREGRPGHWSDMLAVRSDARGRGLGVALKRHQRQLLLERGIDRMWWSFDPLVARNAHINLNRLGATVAEYRRELYGHSDSPLHAGIGTDRLIAEWDLASDDVARRLEGRVPPAPEPAQLLNPADASGAHPVPSAAVEPPAAPVVGVAVPSDLMALKAEELALARAWRGNVREAMEACFAAGYHAVAFRSGPKTGVYVLSRDLDR